MFDWKFDVVEVSLSVGFGESCGDEIQGTSLGH
jgi:hypothetical protein